MTLPKQVGRDELQTLQKERGRGDRTLPQLFFLLHTASMFTIRTVDAVSTPNERLLQSKLQAVLRSDTGMNALSVRVCKNAVTVTLATDLISETDKRMMKSAAHTVILEELEKLNYRPETVAVLLSRTRHAEEARPRAKILPYKPFYDSRPASDYIDMHMESVRAS